MVEQEVRAHLSSRADEVDRLAEPARTQERRQFERQGAIGLPVDFRERDHFIAEVLVGAAGAKLFEVAHTHAAPAFPPAK